MYEDKSADELRDLQRAKNSEVNARRAKGKHAEARKLREEVLAIQAARDVLERQRQKDAYLAFSNYSPEAINGLVYGETAAAVSEAESIVGGKG